MKKLQKAFPAMGPGFFEILAERAAANNFSGEKLNAAICHAIDNIQYKEITVGNIVSYDIKVKLLEYWQVAEISRQYGKSAWENYRPVAIRGKARMYAHVSDINKYGLEIL